MSEPATRTRDLAPIATLIGVLMILAGSGLALSTLVAEPAALDVPRLYAGGVVLFLGLPLMAWPLLRKAGLVEDPNSAWVEAMQRLAAENGQVVQSDSTHGAWFDVVHGGPRFTVLVQPTKGYLELRTKRAARHGVLVVRRGEKPTGEEGRWGEIVRGVTWSLRAEVRVASLALAESTELHRALDRFYAFPGARTVLFAGGGLRLELELPPPELTDRVVRSAMDAARAVWLAWSG